MREMIRGAERHTRGGPRYDVSGRSEEYDDPWDTPTPKAYPGRGGAAQNLRVIAAGACWCGGELGHDYPGKGDTLGHPNETDVG